MQKEISLRLINFERSYYSKNKTKHVNCFLNCIFVTSF